MEGVEGVYAISRAKSFRVFHFNGAERLKNSCELENFPRSHLRLDIWDFGYLEFQYCA